MDNVWAVQELGRVVGGRCWGALTAEVRFRGVAMKPTPTTCCSLHGVAQSTCFGIYDRLGLL